MTKLSTLQRRAAVFSLLSVLLATVLVFRSAETSTQRKEELPRLFDGFSGANARTLEVVQGGSLQSGGQERRVRLERRFDEVTGGDAWVVATSFDYPANADNVARLLSELANARVSGEVTQRQDTFDQYAKDGAWVRVTVKEQTGKDLAALGVGSRSWKTGETNVLLETGGPPRVVRVRDLSDGTARATSDSWLQSRMFPMLEAKAVESFEVVQKFEQDGKVSTRRLAFVRRPQEAAQEGESRPPERGWDMTSPEASPAVRSEVEDTLRSLTGMLIEEVVARGAEALDDAKHGFAAPELVVKVTLAPTQPDKPGATATLTVGALDAGRKVWYARRADADWVFTIKDEEWSTGRLRNDPSKFKEALKEPEKPAEPAPAPAPGPGIGDPDGGPGPEQPKEPPAPPAEPEAPKPPEPAPPPPEQPETPK